MATEATVGLGASFRRWDGSNWVHISEIINIGWTGRNRETVPVVTLDSVDGYRDFLSGLRDGGSITLSLVFRRDVFEIINDDYESDEIQNYEIFLPDDEATSLEFEGLVTEIPLTVAPETIITADVTIKVTGAPVLNSGSGSSA